MAAGRRGSPGFSRGATDGGVGRLNRNQRVRDIAVVARKAAAIRSGQYSRVVTLPGDAGRAVRGDTVSMAAKGPLVLIDASSERSPEDLLRILEGIAGETDKANRAGQDDESTIGVPVRKADGTTEWVPMKRSSGTPPYPG